MNIEPASISSVQMGNDGNVHEISAEAHQVAKDLQTIDPTLHVRFAETDREPHWIVYCQPDERSTYLVLTQKAYQGATGVWLGLDQRVVDEIMRIGHSSYDFADALENNRKARERARDHERSEKLGPVHEQAFYELRKRTGSKSRAFIK